MFKFLLFIGGLGTIVLVLAVIAQRLGLIRGRHKFPYVKRGLLLTPAEIAFHAVLEQAVGDLYRIMAKIRMADLIKVAGAEGRQENRSAVNRICGEYLDFLLCAPDTFETVYAVELDDSSHRRSDRMEPADFSNDVLDDAGLSLFRVRASSSYRVADILQTALRRLPPYRIRRRPFL